MEAKTLLVFVFFLGMFLSVNSFTCRPCGTYPCPSEPKKCPAGTVSDACNCCTVCAKDVGESCGGLWGTRGKCAEGLVCDRHRPSSPSSPPFTTPPYDRERGICRKI